MKIQIVALSLLFILSGCQDRKNDQKPEPPYFPILEPLEFATDGCLNIESLQKILERNAAGFPTYQVTSNFQELSASSNSKSLFYAHSAFDFKELLTNQIYLLRKPTQKGCTEVTALTSSSQPLLFKIELAQINTLKLKLQKNELSDYRSQGLNDKLQVYEIDFFVKGERHLQVISRYENKDTYCRGSKTLKFEMQQDYFWAENVEALPQQLSLDRAFFSKVLLSVGAPPESEAALASDSNHLINTDRLRELRTQVLIDQVAICP